MNNSGSRIRSMFQSTSSFNGRTSDLFDGNAARPFKVFNFEEFTNEEMKNIKNNRQKFLLSNSQVYDEMDLEFMIMDLPKTGQMTDQLDEFSSKDAVRFRLMNTGEKLKEGRHTGLPQHNWPIGVVNTSYSTNPVYAFYQVARPMRRGYELLATHVNLFGETHREFKRLVLDGLSKEVRENRSFCGKLFPGDVLKVFELRSLNHRKRLRVHDFELFPRKIVKDVEIIVTDYNGVKTILVPGMRVSCVEQNEDQRIPVKVDDFEMIRADMCVPQHPHLTVSKDLDTISNLEKMKKVIEKESNRLPQHKNIIMTSELNNDLKNKLKNWQTCCTGGMTREAVQLILCKQKIGCTLLHHTFVFDPSIHQVNEFQCWRNEYGIYCDLEKRFRHTIGREGQKVKLKNEEDQEVVIKIESAREGKDKIELAASQVDKRIPFNMESEPIIASLIIEKKTDWLKILEGVEMKEMDGTCLSILCQLHGYEEKNRRQRNPNFVIDDTIMIQKLNAKQLKFVENVVDGNPLTILTGPSRSGRTIAFLGALITWYNYQMSQHSERKEDISIILVCSTTDEGTERLMEAAWNMRLKLPKMRSFTKRDVRNATTIDELAMPKIIFTTYTSASDKLPEMMKKIDNNWNDKVGLVFVMNARNVPIIPFEMLVRSYDKASVVLIEKSKDCEIMRHGYPDSIEKMISSNVLEVAMENRSIQRVELVEVYPRRDWRVQQARPYERIRNEVSRANSSYESQYREQFENQGPSSSNTTISGQHRNQQFGNGQGSSGQNDANGNLNFGGARHEGQSSNSLSNQQHVNKLARDQQDSLNNHGNFARNYGNQQNNQCRNMNQQPSPQFRNDRGQHYDNIGRNSVDHRNGVGNNRGGNNMGPNRRRGGQNENRRKGNNNGQNNGNRNFPQNPGDRQNDQSISNMSNQRFGNQIARAGPSNFDNHGNFGSNNGNQQNNQSQNMNQQPNSGFRGGRGHHYNSSGGQNRTYQNPNQRDEMRDARAGSNMEPNRQQDGYSNENRSNCSPTGNRNQNGRFRR